MFPVSSKTEKYLATISYGEIGAKRPCLSGTIFF